MFLLELGVASIFDIQCVVVSSSRALNSANDTFIFRYEGFLSASKKEILLPECNEIVPQDVLPVCF